MWKTNGWFRRHAVTASATVVEVGATGAGKHDKQSVTLDVRDPGSGATARVTGELSTSLNHGEYSVGQTLRVRYSGATGDVTDFDHDTVPSEEWLTAPGPGSVGSTIAPAPDLVAVAPPVSTVDFPMSSTTNFTTTSTHHEVHVVNASGLDPAAVRAKLEKVRAMGLISSEDVEQALRELGSAPTAATSWIAPPAAPGPTDASTVEQRLAAIEEVHRSGAISEAERAAQRQRVLDGM